MASCVPSNGADQGNSVQSDAVKGNPKGVGAARAKPLSANGNREKQSGWAGIRTQGTLTGTAVFKTAAFDHSATHPMLVLRCLLNSCRWLSVDICPSISVKVDASGQV